MAEQNLLAPVSVTELPEDPAYNELIENGREDFLNIVSRNPKSLLCWALLAEGSLNVDSLSGDIAAYSYARTGYHLGIEKLKENGWKKNHPGQIPWEHTPNRGFLRVVFALSKAARRLGSSEEAEHFATFLREVSLPAWQTLNNEIR
ncbi:MAG: hypothetical protein CSA83_00750 [Actinomycetales bacterium]|nr:MAG: hypothetical protein CSA83_00750 [Actinomycetales bacterium]